MRFINPIPAFVAATLLAAGTLAAQESETVILGEVIDQVTGQPLDAVHLMIRVDSEGAADDGEVVWEGLTVPSGQFRTTRIPVGTYQVTATAMAFRALSYELTLSGTGSTELTVEMVPAALELDPIVVVVRRSARLERAGFYERRRAGWGYTLTRDEIERRNPHLVSDIFLSIPGARVVRPSANQFQAEVRLRGNCVPTIVLDGNPISRPSRLDDLVIVQNLEAIEVYHTAASPIRIPQNTCGTIMAWTRLGEDINGEPFQWRRLIGAASLFGLALWATR